MYTKASKNIAYMTASIYDYIVEYIGENEEPPTIKEIAYEFRISTTTARKYVRKLCIEGKIDYVEGKARSIVVLGKEQ